MVCLWSGSLRQFSKDYNYITESINVDTKSDVNQSRFVGELARECFENCSKYYVWKII